jgi:hypothetical protein
MKASVKIMLAGYLTDMVSVRGNKSICSWFKNWLPHNLKNHFNQMIPKSSGVSYKIRLMYVSAALTH